MDKNVPHFEGGIFGKKRKNLLYRKKNAITVKKLGNIKNENEPAIETYQQRVEGNKFYVGQLPKVSQGGIST